ncbi:MAG: type II secretion system protein GspK [Verrucomicrobiota bacterium]|nr:type II secretion system protein GspK [Verrucomicrobiota bacterium]
MCRSIKVLRRQHPSGTTPKRSQRKGSVIIAVLAIIALLGAILIAFLAEAAGKIKYWGLFYNRDDLRTEAYSMLETTLAVLSEYHEIDQGLTSPTQGWRNPLAHAGITPPEGISVDIKIDDESGKIPLNTKTDRVLIAKFFENLDEEENQIDFMKAGELTDCLMDWMDADDDKGLNGFDGDDYRDLDPPILPANRELVSWDEFHLIHGWDKVFYDENGLPNQRFTRFKQAFSLINIGVVNLNTITSDALRTIANAYGIDSVWLMMYIAGPDGEIGTADDRQLHKDDPELRRRIDFDHIKGIGFSIDVMKITINAQRGDASFLITAVVRYKTGGADPTANNSGKSREERNEEAQLNDPNQQRGTTAKSSDAGAALGYPFEFVQLVENSKM